MKDVFEKEETQERQAFLESRETFNDIQNKTFKDLSKLTGYAVSTLYKVSSGHLKPNHKMRQKIEEALDVLPTIWEV